MKTGLFGGSFDPIHWGHLFLAEYVKDYCSLDRVIFIPASLSPHKTDAQMAPDSFRLALVQAAVEGHAGLEVSDIEVKRQGTSYTLETIQELKQRPEFLDDEFSLIIGFDNLAVFNAWKHPRRILDEVRVIVVKRTCQSAAHIPEDFLTKVTLLDSPTIDISSSEIRRRVREGKSIHFWVPENVENRIHEKGVYR